MRGGAETAGPSWPGALGGRRRAAKQLRAPCGSRPGGAAVASAPVNRSQPRRVTLIVRCGTYGTSAEGTARGQRHRVRGW
jgi:hypothetical protein